MDLLTEKEVKKNFIFDEGNLAVLDKEISQLIDLETERQKRKIILIPSESICPKVVREALASPFTCIYAEGYPALRMSKEERARLGDFSRQMVFQRRYGDRRFYKGCEYVNFIEAIAQKRVIELFATEKVPAENIFANVQSLSGAAANNAVYEAFLQHGDVVMGMDLTHGGHLTHGSEYNRSGKTYKVAAYQVDPATGKLNYEEIRKKALQHRPKLIIGGYSAYPWNISWKKFREIADEVGAYLLADISHPVGLVIAGYYDSPIGYADAVSFTTHKTLCGPRGAVILTTDPQKAALVDTAVFPGEQGGPHINNIAAKAVAFGLAKTEAFRALQKRIIENTQHLAEALVREGLKLAYGGTDTHLLLVDLKGLKKKYPLKGEIASRILDLCGITCNKNTIPGDDNAAHPSAIRMGTTWATQRGMGKGEMDKIASLVAYTLDNIEPFEYIEVKGNVGRGKIDYHYLETVKSGVEELIKGVDTKEEDLKSGYPFYFTFPQELEDKFAGEKIDFLEICGERSTPFLQEVLTNNVYAMADGEGQYSFMLDDEGNYLDYVFIFKHNKDYYVMVTHAEKTKKIKLWLRGLSDGYIKFQTDDIWAKVQGPLLISHLSPNEDTEKINRKIKEDFYLPKWKEHLLAADLLKDYPELFLLTKPYFVGQKQFLTKEADPNKEKFVFTAKEQPLKRSCLYNEHVKLTKKIVPFAGWEMPVWYTCIQEEHDAVRKTAGLFDVSHMGILEFSGEGAARFLDVVCTNYVEKLLPGQSMYAYLLDINGIPIDDILIYCRDRNKFMVVVNAANNDKDIEWLIGLNENKFIIDKDNPTRTIDVKVTIKNLKDPACGDEQKVDVSLQGPSSLPMVLRLFENDPTALNKIKNLIRGEFAELTFQGREILVSRTGYTGEEYGFEFYLHPELAPVLWNLILEKGKDLDIKPTGLGSRDSTRTEAGLPLYGHELASSLNIVPGEAGYGAFVKFHKPFFIGRRVAIEKELTRTNEIIRFQMQEKGVRKIETGDIVVTKRGDYIGRVTSSVLIDGQQMGLAYVNKKYAKEGTRLGIFPMPKDKKAKGEKPKEILSHGDKVLLHEEAVVLSRFPKA